MIKVPDKEYWVRRSELTLIANEKSTLQYEQELKKAYLEAIQRITKEIEAFYGRYAKDNQISLLETRKRLRPDELLNFNKQAKLYLDEVERLGDKAFTAEYREYLKELSGKAYISRMEELITNIRHNIETLSTGYNIGLGQILTEAYQDGFYRTMFDVQKQVGFGISFTAPGGKQLEMTIKERWLGQNYSDRIWADKNKLIIQLEQMLSQEFVRGRGPREVAKDFSDKMQTSYYNAQRLIRTELNYISNKGSMKAYEESEVVEKYQYLATLDNRTSDICRELDGKIFEIKEAKVGVNLPPLHPHCRSTTIPYFEDNEIEDRVARSEDGEGKSYKLGEDVTFFDWVDKYGSPEFKKRVTEQRKRFLDMDETPQRILNLTKWERLFDGLDNYNKEALLKQLEQVAPDNMQLMNNALKDIKIEVREGEGNYYDISKHLIVLSNDPVDEYYNTIFHEIGHAVLKNKQESLKTYYSKMNDSFAKWLNKNLNTNYKVSEYGLYQHEERTLRSGRKKAIENYDISEDLIKKAEEKIRADFNDLAIKLNSYENLSRVSDIFDAVSEGNFERISSYYGGHGREYYRRDYITRMDETFANMFQLEVVKEQAAIDYIKKELPEVYSNYQALKKEVIENEQK